MIVEVFHALSKRMPVSLVYVSRPCRSNVLFVNGSHLQDNDEYLETESVEVRSAMVEKRLGSLENTLVYLTCPHRLVYVKDTLWIQANCIHDVWLRPRNISLRKSRGITAYTVNPDSYRPRT